MWVGVPLQFSGAIGGVIGMIRVMQLLVYGLVFLVLIGPRPSFAQTRAEFEQWRHNLVDKILA